MLHSKTEKDLKLLGNGPKMKIPKLLSLTTFEKENGLVDNLDNPRTKTAKSSYMLKKSANSLSNSDLLTYMSRNLSLYNQEREKMQRTILPTFHKSNLVENIFTPIRPTTSATYNNCFRQVNLNSIVARAISKKNNLHKRQVTHAECPDSSDGKTIGLRIRNFKNRNNELQNSVKKLNKLYKEEMGFISNNIIKESSLLFDPRLQRGPISNIPIEIHLGEWRFIIKMIDLRANTSILVKIYTHSYEGKLSQSANKADNIDVYISKTNYNPNDDDYELHYKKINFTLKVLNNETDPKYIYIKINTKNDIRSDITFNFEETRKKKLGGPVRLIQSAKGRNEIENLVGELDHQQLIKEQENINVFQHIQDDPDFLSINKRNKLKIEQQKPKKIYWDLDGHRRRISQARSDFKNGFGNFSSTNSRATNFNASNNE